MAFSEVSSEATNSESEFWDVALNTEAKIRAYLVDKKIQIVTIKSCKIDLKKIISEKGTSGLKYLRTVTSTVNTKAAKIRSIAP